MSDHASVAPSLVSGGDGRSQAELSSIEKGLRLLRVLAATQDGMTTGELSSISGLNRSTTYRLCEMLERGGWVQWVPNRDGAKRVGLGPTILGLSILITNAFDTTARLQPIIDRLAVTLGETVHVGVLEQNDVVHIARAMPGSTALFAAELGGRDAAYVTSLGKALLAMLPREDVRRMYPARVLPRRTPATIGTVDDLLEELDRIAAQGYAIDDEESRAGVRCVGAPVFGVDDRLLFAISVTSAPARLDGDQLLDAIEAVKACAALLTTSFGGSPTVARRSARGGS